MDDKKQKTYELKIKCLNCNSNMKLYIPTGETISNFLEDGKCTNCECRLVKKGSKEYIRWH